jgi:soluble lytic murein transglycosylase
VPEHEKQARRRRSERQRETRDDRRGRRDDPRDDRGDTRRDRRGGGFGRVIRGLFFGVLLLALAFSFLRYSQEKTRLQALRDDWQARIEAHEKELGYYIQMRRNSGYDEYIRQFALEFQVDRSFISAIIARDSHYDTKAESHVGARGLMQIMQDTGEWVSGRLAVRPYSYELLFEPELNIRFGSWYLGYLSGQFNGNPVMIASAYHAGANNVKLWALKYAEDKRTLRMDQIPTDDTKDYVQKVMNAYALFYEYDSTR